jgi:Amt family ammonium transporter
MVFYAFGAVLVCWMIYAYKAAFGKQMLPFVGMLRHI